MIFLLEQSFVQKALLDLTHKVIYKIPMPLFKDNFPLLRHTLKRLFWQKAKIK